MSTATDTPPKVLHVRMVERILAGQHLAADVEAALRRVERHRYVPDAPIKNGYDETAVVTQHFRTEPTRAAHPVP